MAPSVRICKIDLVYPTRTATRWANAGQHAGAVRRAAAELGGSRPPGPWRPAAFPGCAAALQTACAAPAAPHHKLSRQLPQSFKPQVPIGVINIQLCCILITPSSDSRASPSYPHQKLQTAVLEQRRALKDSNIAFWQARLLQQNMSAIQPPQINQAHMQRQHPQKPESPPRCSYVICALELQ